MHLSWNIFNLLIKTEWVKNSNPLARSINYKMYKKLNLGSGDKKIEGFLNLDKFDTFKPDIVHDLENFPYPFSDNEVDEIKLIHVLEHIGKDPDIYIKILKELYRICINEALIHIIVPHPRHDDFLSDPTHVRPITTMGLLLFDRELNEKWIELGAANTPMAVIHNVNFKIIKNEISLEKKYDELYKNKKISTQVLEEYINKYNNVVKQTYYILKVIK